MKTSLERHSQPCHCHSCSAVEVTAIEAQDMALEQKGRADPTGTTTAQREYARFLRDKFGKVNARVRELINEEDALGLREDSDGRWANRSDADTMRAFDEWLNRAVEEEVIEPHDSKSVRRKFERATEAGIRDAQADTRKAALKAKRAGDITTEEYKKVVDNLPDRKERVDDIDVQNEIDREVEESRQRVEGVAERLKQGVRGAVGAGIEGALSPSRVAADVTERANVAKSDVTSTASARIVNQFNSTKLGEWDEVRADLTISIEAEWITAGDNRVCAECWFQSQREWTFEEAKAEDLIPLHPNCRCKWQITQVAEVF